MHLLLIDEQYTILQDAPENVIFYYIKQLNFGVGAEIIKKYKKNADKLRWALKPVFMNYLLNTQKKVIYVDNDIYFFGDYLFLFEDLESNSIILTPHFYRSDPLKEQNWLVAYFRVGLYNAGFVGANANATFALEWWAYCCLYNVKKSYWRGLFDDQKYLDLLPILFDNIRVLKNRGCNLAGWNYENYIVKRNDVNELIIENKYPLVFIHFAEVSLLKFSDPNNPFFIEYNIYISAIKKYSPAFKIEHKLFKKAYIYRYCMSFIVNYFLYYTFLLFGRNLKEKPLYNGSFLDIIFKK